MPLGPAGDAGAEDKQQRVRDAGRLARPKPQSLNKPLRHDGVQNEGTVGSLAVLDQLSSRTMPAQARAHDHTGVPMSIAHSHARACARRARSQACTAHHAFGGKFLFRNRWCTVASSARMTASWTAGQNCFAPMVSDSRMTGGSKSGPSKSPGSVSPSSASAPPPRCHVGHGCPPQNTQPSRAARADAFGTHAPARRPGARRKLEGCSTRWWGGTGSQCGF